VDLQHTPRQLCLIHWPPAYAELYEYRFGTIEGVGEDEVSGSDDQAGWAAAGERGVIYRVDEDESSTLRTSLRDYLVQESASKTEPCKGTLARKE